MKTFKRLVVSIVSLSLTVSLTGCGIIRDMMSLINGDYSEEPSQSEPTTHEEVEGVIGQNGGVVEDEESNVRISIPQGALSEETTITAQYIEDETQSSSDISNNFLAAVEFGPSGTTFDKPVEVNLKLTKTPKNSKIAVFCLDEKNNIWDYVTSATISGNNAKFNITHFSKYEALDITDAMYMKYVEIVYEAQSTGQSDTWIRDTYENYLIDEEHVMDYYQEYDGYYYEPCGLSIFGKYQIDNKVGNQEDLATVMGSSNKKGDTYGLSQVGGLTVSKAEADKVTNNQEVIDVTVTIYYKIINPDFSMSASKDKVEAGESTTISVLCHYAKAGNVVYPDIVLPGYPLNVSQPTHFTVDKTLITTDGSGRASFVATSIDGEEDTLKVIFADAEAYAEGSITINGNGYILSGHIKEEFSVTYYVPSDGSYTVVSKGFANITVEYDFEGTLRKNENDDDYSGTIGFSNISGSVSGSVPFETVEVDENLKEFRTRTNMFESFKNSNDNYSETYPITATASSGSCVTSLAPNASSINIEAGPYVGTAWFNHTIVMINDGNPIGGNSSTTFCIKLKPNPLLDFNLEKGEQTNTANYLKDSTELLEIFFEGYDYSFTGTKTTQTIIVG